MGEVYPGEHRKVPERTGRLWTPEGRNWQHSACMRQRDVEPVQLCEQLVQHQDQGDNWCQEQTAGSSAESKSIIMSNPLHPEHNEKKSILYNHAYICNYMSRDGWIVSFFVYHLLNRSVFLQ